MHMMLSKAKVGHRACIKCVEGNEKLKKFLFTLGCYPGEEITLISKLSDNYVVNIKDSRYAIDGNMAKLIELVD